MRFKKMCALAYHVNLFIEKGLRGGISYITKRYANVNMKYMKNYDPTKLKLLKFIT